jgi:hypothetical protein
VVTITAAHINTTAFTNHKVHADYNTTVNSWIEQRTFVTAGPSILRNDAPEFAAELESELRSLENPTPPSTDGFTMASLKMVDVGSFLFCVFQKFTSFTPQ